MTTSRALLLGAAGTLAVIAIAGAASLSGAAPREGGAEVEFARDMGAHHAQAVEMSLTMMRRTRDDDLRLLATDITLTQQGQIGQMQGWLAAWGRSQSGERPPMDGMNREAMGIASQQQVRALETAPLSTAEVSYLKLMIRHHQGGVAMASGVLSKTSRPEVTRLARAIVAGQRNEIAVLRALLAKRGEATKPDAPVEHH